MSNSEERYFISARSFGDIEPEFGTEGSREDMKLWLMIHKSFRDFEIRKAVITPRENREIVDIEGQTQWVWKQIDIGPFWAAPKLSNLDQQRLERSLKNEIRFGKVKRLLGAGL